MTYVAIAIGAFYVFAGVVVLRAMALDRVMDQLLVALNEPSAPKERMKSRVLTVGAALTLASGVALMLLSPLAPPLFVASALWQGGYLIWAEKALPPEDESDARGRQQTKNAFVVYLAATAFVVWLAMRELLRPWGAPLQLIALDVLLIGAATVGALLALRSPRRGGDPKRASVVEIEGAGRGDARGPGRETSTPIVEIEIPDLAEYTQPYGNEPDEVARTFRSVMAAHDEESGDKAYHRLLYAVGNNHAGTYNSVVLAIIPTLGQVLRDGGPWAQRTVLEAMIDLYSSFEPESDEETFRGEPLRERVRRSIQELEPLILPLANREETPGRSAKALLAAIRDD